MEPDVSGAGMSGAHSGVSDLSVALQCSITYLLW